MHMDRHASTNTKAVPATSIIKAQPVPKERGLIFRTLENIQMNKHVNQQIKLKQS